MHICNVCQKSKITALSKRTGSTEKNEILQKQGSRDTEDFVIYSPSQRKNLWTVSLKVEAGSPATPPTQTRKEWSLCHLSSRAAYAFPYLPAWDAHLPAQEWTLRTPGQCGSQQCSYSSQSHFQSLVSPVKGMKAHARIRKPFSLCECTLHFAGERSHNKSTRANTDGCPQRGELQQAESQRQGGDGVFYYLIFLAFMCQKHYTTSCLPTGCPDKRLNSFNIRNINYLIALSLPGCIYLLPSLLFLTSR